MPFKSKEQRREYSKLWARRKALTLVKPKPYEFAVSDKPNFSNLKTYEACVEKAQEVVKLKKLSQLAIGGLALRACEIRWGGNQKEETLKPRLKEFAKEIGVSSKALCDWVKAVRFLKNLPDSIPFRYTDLHYALREANQHGGDAKEYYLELLDSESRLRTTILVERFCDSLRYQINKVTPSRISPREKKALIEIRDRINEVLQ
jgi:hypothetical protein